MDPEETALAALKKAVDRDLDIVAVAEEVSGQALLRLVCEVRQVASRAPRLTTTGISRANVTPAGQLSYVLEGAADDQETPSIEYFQQCRSQLAYKGFACAVITASEDRVDSLAPPALVLRHRLVLFRPTALADFELLTVLMYLESCPPDHATPSMFVRLSAWLKRVGRRTSPLQRLRCLLLRSCQWVLNTLMFMAHVEPFSDAFVLPHWYLARCLMAAGETLPIVGALFSAPTIGPPPQSSTRDDCVAYRHDSIMSRPWKSEVFRRALLDWWASVPNKTRGESLFYCFE
ncbi:tegument protein UL7 [Saimiriine alphaherpesvirus 1]|uniref:Tegument protein UL7 n=1 Tax=Saimiriine herpesvirus 1 (strain MV-5-4-PSL) TaxID=10353 RepID=E2IUG3_SHV1|nr:tegument protein UL7 [Saimiriine alphaherpesvirus 1]ADO13821.1 tegument protein UL7 [Saimiriine alphaherpesvirus 1]